MGDKRLHALHNVKVCELLRGAGNGEFNDWVVTTAFYAALQLVHHHIFPLPMFNKVFKTFNSYYLNKYYNNEVAKHTVTRNLVKAYIPKVSARYDWLFRECYNARYKNFNINMQVANTAKEYLDEIMINTLK